jgi:hypothetical protein
VTAVVLWLSDRAAPSMIGPPASGAKRSGRPGLSTRSPRPPDWGPPAATRLVTPDDRAGWGPPAGS